uniref:Uncharacterized protein n=1 Tax=Trichuris muris TaxID=70415 RepID=A0A5S6QGJ7_TRIMR
MLQLFVLRLLPRCETITEDHDFVVRSVARKLRASLCGVLNTFLLNPHPKAPYYLNVAIDLLRRGSVDKGDILTGLSKHGLSICDRITKPMVPFSHSLTCAEVERNPDGTATDVEILSGHLKESFNFGKAGSIIQRHDERRRSPINDVVVTKRQRVNSDEPQVTSSISTELTQLSSPKMDSCFRTLTDLQRDDSDSFNCIDESQSDHIPANENGCDASSDSGSSLDFEVNLVPKNSH